MYGIERFLWVQQQVDLAPVAARGWGCEEEAWLSVEHRDHLQTSICRACVSISAAIHTFVTWFWREIQFSQFHNTKHNTPGLVAVQVFKLVFFTFVIVNGNLETYTTFSDRTVLTQVSGQTDNPIHVGQQTSHGTQSKVVHSCCSSATETTKTYPTFEQPSISDQVHDLRRGCLHSCAWQKNETCSCSSGLFSAINWIFFVTGRQKTEQLMCVAKNMLLLFQMGFWERRAAES